MSTSADAYRSVEGSAASMRTAIEEYIAGRYDGATCDEIEEALNMKHQTASARVNELRHLNRIRRTLDTRPTRSGRAAVVYIVAGE